MDSIVEQGIYCGVLEMAVVDWRVEMTLCDKCGKEVGPLFCGHCREAIMGGQPKIKDTIPVLFYDTKLKLYFAGCLCYECPWNNKDGVCSTGYQSIEMFKNLCHEFDGDNCVHQVCG